METTNTTQPPKRPTGMTILLVLSFLNACLNIFSSIIMYFGTPMLSEMIRSGQFEDALAPFKASANPETWSAMIGSMTAFSQIKPIYYLFMLGLFIISLVGVVRMFKFDKRGFHFYSISQLLMLIAASVYKYPLLHPSPFVSDLLLTAMFIIVYYLYFKRKETAETQQNPQ